MHSSKKGFAALTLIIGLTLVTVIAVGFWVYSKQQNEASTSVNTSGKSYTILAVGDIACDPANPNFNDGDGLNNDCQHKKVVEQMKQQNTDALLLLGDIQYESGSFEAFEKSFVPAYKDFPAKIIAVPGNHDWASGRIDGYLQTFSKHFPDSLTSNEGKTYFNTKLGAWSIYALDSDCEFVGGCDEGSEQYKWLQAELAQDKSLCTLAIWHHPIFTSGYHEADGSEKRAKKLYELLQKNNAELVLSGHDHNYQRFAKKMSDGRLSTNGIRSFVSGGGGAELHKINQPLELGEDYAISGFGFLKVTLNQNDYNWEYISIEGQALDKGSDSCR